MMWKRRTFSPIARTRKGHAFAWGLWVWGVSLVALLVPQCGNAQSLLPHGTVSQVRGQTIEVEVKPDYDVPEGATGTVFARNEVGGTEQQVPVAEMTVETVENTVVVGRIAEQLGAISPKTGFKVAFSTVRRTSAERHPERGVLRLATVPAGAEVTVRPLRSTATGRLVHRNARSLGTTPVADSLLPGRYQVTIQKEGYPAARRRLVLRPGATRADSVRLGRGEREDR